MTKNCLLRSSCLSVNLETPCLNIRLSRATATSILVVMDCLVVEVNMNTDKVRDLNIQIDLLQKDYEMLVAQPYTRRKHFNLL